ncbi:MAG: 2-oxoglutarate dehydrogenase E2 component (dihydrolipoamide succinyltransferase) [Flavobacteriales bacterium]|jgi:2-oxoglutarate dehydrogenase E2 component (dihydrolipoamide succinyltransferase)
MAQVELIMPKMGESVAEATLIKWLKDEGEVIELEESVIEIATDKVDSEVPSPVEGVLIKKLFNEDDVVLVGQVVGIIETDGDAPAAAPVEKAAAPAAAAEKIETEVNEAVADANPLAKTSDSGKFYSPLVRSIAQEEGISMSELETIAGSGLEGRVNKDDILAFVANRSKGGSVSAPAKKSSPAKASEPKAPAISVNRGDELIEMDRMRKLIADHMIMSKRVSPHVTSMIEVDMTNIVLWRNKVKDAFFKREGEKITFTPIFIEAVTQAIKDFPMINVSVDGTTIVKRKDINIGMAAALPSGNLIVPVIHKADAKNLMGITKSVNDLAKRARNNALTPDEVSGGTFTLTNVGTFGNIMGTPIINQPQVAILAVGAIKKKPAVIETPQGDTIGIRHLMFMSLSYDHRVVDGALGGSFLRRVGDYLEAFDMDRNI